jgi:hypothetical protein
VARVAAGAAVSGGVAMTDGRRAPVQREHWPRHPEYKPPGTIAWSEHEEAWRAYSARYGNDQSAQHIAERHGFGYYEITKLLGREPTTWVPR